MSKLNMSKIFKSAHAITKSVIQKGDSYQITFGACLKLIYKGEKMQLQGTDKQVKWAKDAYSRYATKAIEGINDLQSLKETELRKNLQEAIITTNVGKVRPLTNQTELDNLCDEIKSKIEAMTALEWIHFDDAFKNTESSIQMLSLYTNALNKIKGE